MFWMSKLGCLFWEFELLGVTQKPLLHRKTSYGVKHHKPTVFGHYVDLADPVVSYSTPGLLFYPYRN